MGHRVTQRILDCAHCGRTPEDGEYLWDMSRKGHICEQCIDEDRDIAEVEQVEGKA